MSKTASNREKLHISATFTEDDDLAAIVALDYFKKKHWSGRAYLHEVIHHVLRVALAHPVEISNWIDGIAMYRVEEGFEDIAAADIAIARSRIAGRIEYKRHWKKLRKQHEQNCQLKA